VDRESYVHVEAADRLREEALAALGAFHAREPLKPGMSRRSCGRASAGSTSGSSSSSSTASPPALIAVEKDKVRLAGHQVRLDAQQQGRLDRLETEFREAGVAPPSLEEAFATLGMTRPDEQALLQVLLDERRLVRVKEGLYFHVEPLRAAEVRVAAFLREKKEITPQDMKDRYLPEVRDPAPGVPRRPAADGPRRDRRCCAAAAERGCARPRSGRRAVLAVACAAHFLRRLSTCSTSSCRSGPASSA
jgi:hypothetical protein